MIRSKNIIAVPPGATIKEQLQDRGMSQKEFASRIEMTEKHISQLINGNVPLTPDVAVRLEMVLGIPANFWNKLEAIYREKNIKANAENEMEEDKELVKLFPYSEMSKNGWVPQATKPTDKVINLRKFFEVVRLTLLKGTGDVGLAYRRLGESEKGDYGLMAWSQKAKLDARGIFVKAVNIQKLEASIGEMRAMTMMSPEEFCPQLCEILSECGIALVFLPHIKGTFLHGATFYDGKKIVLGMTVRGKDADRFWFSLFHEIGHIVLGHIALKSGPTSEDESAADAFSADTLISPKDYKRFIEKGDFSEESIVGFANKIGIDRGIVVGRLQKEGHIKYNSSLNNLKIKLV
ncbi:MAG: helix-turn-helix domain-containing protein [Lentihominibacter sp.]|jgi:HTH-type transcriptional regulator/antitoxin HigA